MAAIRFGRPAWGLLIGVILIVGMLLPAAIRLMREAQNVHVVYLGWDAEEQVQIFQAELGTSHIQKLTSAPFGIQDYSLSPDYRQIAYTASGSTGSSIWLMTAQGQEQRQLLDCQPDTCQTIVWHPDGQLFTYERKAAGPDQIPGPPRLWWLDPASGQTSLMLENAEQLSQGASFSPDGQWLSYLGSPDDGLFAFNFQTRLHLQFPSEMGTPAVWSPDSEALLFRNNQVIVVHAADDDDHQGHSHDFSLGVYIFRADLRNDEVIPLSGTDIVDDASAAWQPEGEWIAFGRKQPRTSMGRQLWIMRPDGSQARALTDDPAIHHGLPAWSPDGRALLFQRYPVLDADAVPSIWLYELETGEQRQLLSPGFQPSWLP